METSMFGANKKGEEKIAEENQVRVESGKGVKILTFPGGKIMSSRPSPRGGTPVREFGAAFGGTPSLMHGRVTPHRTARAFGVA
jgi:hypothetical protein